MALNALYPVLCSEHLAASRDFYMHLLELHVTFENDWYVSLAGAQPSQQIAFVERSHQSVPSADRVLPCGFLVTIETDDVDGAYQRATVANAKVELELRDEPWGQRHFIVRDPNGVLVDVVKLIPPSDEYARAYVGES